MVDILNITVEEYKRLIDRMRELSRSIPQWYEEYKAQPNTDMLQKILDSSVELCNIFNKTLNTRISRRFTDIGIIFSTEPDFFVAARKAHKYLREVVKKQIDEGADVEKLLEELATELSYYERADVWPHKLWTELELKYLCEEIYKRNLVVGPLTLEMMLAAQILKMAEERGLFSSQ